MTGRDAGLQPERTSLAWRRTALAMVAVVVLTARLALPRGTVGQLIAASAAAGWVLLMLLVFLPRGRPRATAPSAGQPRVGGPELPVVALATAAYAALGAILILTVPS